MKNLRLIVNVFVALVLQPMQLVVAETRPERNMRDAETEYRRQQTENERRAYQKYLRDHDYESGISQRTGPVGGRTYDGKGYYGGWQWSTR